ncbi:MAG TPA: hypothetical protein VHD90_26035, partial [Phototrophicaceae bacterium]|nr:hypothetical protein [Phototrophicaceae bacterium]
VMLEGVGRKAVFRKCVIKVSYLRGVIEEPRFTEDFDLFRQRYPDMDEIHRWITDQLGENPRLGEVLKQSPEYRTLVTLAVGKTPAFWVFYKFDERNVYLLSIEPVHEDNQ